MHVVFSASPMLNNNQSMLAYASGLLSETTKSILPPFYEQIVTHPATQEPHSWPYRGKLACGGVWTSQVILKKAVKKTKSSASNSLQIGINVTMCKEIHNVGGRELQEKPSLFDTLGATIKTVISKDDSLSLNLFPLSRLPPVTRNQINQIGFDWYLSDEGSQSEP